MWWTSSNLLTTITSYNNKIKISCHHSRNNSNRRVLPHPQTVQIPPFTTETPCSSSRSNHLRTRPTCQAWTTTSPCLTECSWRTNTSPALLYSRLVVVSSRSRKRDRLWCFKYHRLSISSSRKFQRLTTMTDSRELAGLRCRSGAQQQQVEQPRCWVCITWWPLVIPTSLSNSIFINSRLNNSSPSLTAISMPIPM